MTKISLEDLLEEAQNYKLDADYIDDVEIIKLYDNKCYFRIPISDTVNNSTYLISLYGKYHGRWLYDYNNTFVDNFGYKLPLRVLYET